MTEYIILRYLPPTEEEPDQESWETFGRAKASSPKRAISAATVEAGDYVAVPLRSWKPLTVTVEQTTKVTIS